MNEPDEKPDPFLATDGNSPEGRKLFLKTEWELASQWFCQLTDEEVTQLVTSIEIVLQSGSHGVVMSMPMVHLARLSLIQLIDKFRSSHKVGDGISKPSEN